MMKKKIGSRVGAILSGKNGVVRFLGYGKYVGDFVPPEEIGGFNFGQPNPKIELDSGKVVYGCECWWGSEAAIKRELEKYDEVVETDIDQVREKANSGE